MGELKLKLPDNVERVFRRLAMKRFGYQKGAMSEAAKEAIEEWSNMHEINVEEKEQSWDSLVGIMKHVKKNSVELQHEAWNNLTKKYKKRAK